MPMLVYKQSGWQRWLQRIGMSRAGAMVFSKIAHPIDRALMRVSGNRLSAPGLFFGLPAILLTTTGAKSGLPRTLPVVGIPDGEQILLIASNWGQAHHPGWCHNLRANPTAVVEFNGHTGNYAAQEIGDPDEYARCWQKAVAVYPGYNAYKQRTGGRVIPVFRLTPVQLRNAGVPST